MSASEKLKALNLEPFAFVEDQSGTTAVAIELSRFREWQAALPQIVAVIEAAEKAEQAPFGAEVRLLREALFALDEGLS